MNQDVVGRALFSVTGVVLLASGLPLLFAADVVAAWLNLPGAAGELAVQLIASGLLGLGAVNFWSRGQFVGGIYGRPLGLGNLLCFLSAWASLGRAVGAGVLPPSMWVAVVLSAVLTLAFAWRLFFWRPDGRVGRVSGT
ncbi:hypothetical protein [Deinococcus pimensis]|uniref:hypothetical protein n=1 Tax=Deinococcus pimensis TaxID=309888 RepID=UPI000481CE95|nr:hypothetical protein [Deinococcus pimensis]